MGAGSHFLRALKRVPAAALGMLVVCCIDFVEPDLPELGAPAVIEATIQLSDRGSAGISARLAPGLDETGRRRQVADESIEVLGRTLGPDSVLRNGTRSYAVTWVADPSVVAQPASFRAPVMRGVEAPPPGIEWTGIRRLDEDSLNLERGRDLELLIGRGPGVASPAPDIRQWFLSMKGDSSTFGISADGPPPDTILVPARWIPEGDRIEIRLIFSQSAFLQPPPGDYLGLVTLDTRLYWTLRLTAPTASPAGRPRHHADRRPHRSSARRVMPSAVRDDG